MITPFIGYVKKYSDNFFTISKNEPTDDVNIGCHLVLYSEFNMVHFG